MRRLFICVFSAGIFVYFSAASGPFRGKNSEPGLQAGQIIVVLTNGWDSAKATLYACQKVQGKWVLQFSNPVFVGAKGLGIGDGAETLNIPGAPVKKEGDLKAPAGIFTIGAAFGYAAAADAAWIKAKYIQAKDTVICVDDIYSVYYNRVIATDTTTRHDWTSFEYMHRKDDYYKWGLFVNHNAPGTKAGDGSCIFIHIGKGDNFATEGCTAMVENDMLRLLHWIDASKQPLLVQVPAAEYDKIREQFNLPAVK